MQYNNSFIEQVKAKNDIIEVIGQYCKLDKKGGGYWACCPLPGHMEKTPSFCVNEDGQFFKCFGCGEGGDVIKFIMKIEGLEFYEAVRFLADRAGLEMPDENFDKDEERLKLTKSKKEKMLAVLRETAKYYCNNLWADERAEAHRNYLEKRGIDKKTSLQFGLGASLDYKSLPKHLTEKGYNYEDMLTAGVVFYDEKRKEYSDFQGCRLIIPIIDSFQNVIAFGGRVMEKTNFAKYKNTQETELFIKNKTLYNINNLKKLRKMGNIDCVIMVEGYMDTISLVTAGFNNVVASMGTSLTVSQAKLVKRYTDTVVISYDGDAAGQKATIRGLEIMRDAGLTVKILSLPSGLDPDDYVKKFGADSYRELVINSLPLIDYKLDYLHKHFDVNTVIGKRKYIENAIRVIAESQNSFEQEELLKKLGVTSDIAYEFLRRDFDKYVSGQVISPIKPQTISEDKQSVENSLIQAERYILCVLIANKTYATVDDVSDYEFTQPIRKRLFDYLLAKADAGERIFAATLSDVLGDDAITELNLVLTASDGVFGTPTEAKYYADCLSFINKTVLNNEIKVLEQMYKNEADTAERKRLAVLMQNKIKKLNTKV